MAVFSMTGVYVLAGSAWTGTAPGTGSAPSGTITSTTDLSPMLTGITLDLAQDELDSTNFGSAGYRQKLGGLQAATITLNFNQDFAASQVDALFGIGGTFGHGSAGPFYLDVKATSASRSATNPSYVFAWLPLNYTVLTGSVGDLATVSLQFPSTGRYARLTS